MYKQFVSSRVGEIQSNSDPKQWRHIPSESNVADDVSRGIAVPELNGRWQQGPDFLRLPENEWPTEKSKPDESEIVKEVRKTVLAVKTTENPIDPKKFSSWRKLIRVTAYVLRFVKYIRNKARSKDEAQEPPVSTDCLTPQELEDAE